MTWTLSYIAVLGNFLQCLVDSIHQLFQQQQRQLAVIKFSTNLSYSQSQLMPLALCLVLPSLQPLIMIHDLLVTVLVLSITG